MSGPDRRFIKRNLVAQSDVERSEEMVDVFDYESCRREKRLKPMEGATLLAAILAAEVNLSHNCEGNAACGTCHIFVHEGRKGVSKIAREENEKLDSIVGVGSKSRLACQAKVLGTENIKVELLGFGSGI